METIQESCVEKGMESGPVMETLQPIDYEIQTNPIGLPREEPPCYVPQNGDDLPFQNIPDPLGAVGPWATGKVDWSPLAGLTGIRPVVDHYTITRYSPAEWRKRNEEIIQNFNNAKNESVRIENDSKNTIIRTFSITDQVQKNSTCRLQDRARDVDKWKETLGRAIAAMTEEISTMEEQRRRLKQSLAVLRVPEAIATECLDRRTARPDHELVRDDPEEELTREVALISEIRDLLNHTLADIEAQQVENRSAKQRMEHDWSDKKEAHEIEAVNCHLNNKSRTILFKPGATRYPNEQSSEESWEHFTRDTLNATEHTRQKSICLRNTLDAILLNATRDLRSQADIVERALNKRITCMDEIRQRLENDLKTCLQRLADTETQIDKLQTAIKSMDPPMKVAQTRLDNRHCRRLRVENCRDKPQEELIDEVQNIQEGITAMQAQLKQSNHIKNELMSVRAVLEREIMLKRRAIQIDKERCQLLRSHFPSATALSGY